MTTERKWEVALSIVGLLGMFAFLTFILIEASDMVLDVWLIATLIIIGALVGLTVSQLLGDLFKIESLKIMKKIIVWYYGADEK